MFGIRCTRVFVWFLFISKVESSWLSRCFYLCKIICWCMCDLEKFYVTFGGMQAPSRCTQHPRSRTLVLWVSIVEQQEGTEAQWERESSLRFCDNCKVASSCWLSIEWGIYLSLYQKNIYIILNIHRYDVVVPVWFLEQLKRILNCVLYKLEEWVYVPIQ